MSSRSTTTTDNSTTRRAHERRNRRKERSTSSLAGMFQADPSPAPKSAARPATASTPPLAIPRSNADIVVDQSASSSLEKYSDAERRELLEMTRKLRQAKRRLFLKSVSPSSDSVERFREVLLRISCDEKSRE